MTARVLQYVVKFAVWTVIWLVILAGIGGTAHLAWNLIQWGWAVWS